MISRLPNVFDHIIILKFELLQHNVQCIETTCSHVNKLKVTVSVLYVITIVYE